MKPTNLLVHKELEKRVHALRVKVDVKLLRKGDLVEFLELHGGWHGGRVVRIEPRAGRVVVGPYARADFPRGYKDLALYARAARNRVVLAYQLVGVMVGVPGHRQSIRPGTPEWLQFTEARTKGHDSSTTLLRGVDDPGERASSPGETAAKSAARAFQAELREALAQERSS